MKSTNTPNGHFSRSVFDNIAYDRLNATQDEVLAAPRAIRVPATADAKPLPVANVRYLVRANVPQLASKAD